MGVKRGRFFYNHIRREVAAGLVKKRGYDWEAARQAVNDMTDSEIDGLADKAKIGAPSGGFLQWLIDHGPQIMQLISMIMAMFSLKGQEGVDAVMGAEDESDEESHGGRKAGKKKASDEDDEDEEP